MNRRTSKLLGYVAKALVQGQMADGSPLPRLKRKLKAEWNAKPRPIRHEQRMALIRTLVKLENQSVGTIPQ